MIKLWLIIIIIIPLASAAAAAAAPLSSSSMMVKPNCTAKCGNVDIFYPFGIGEGCYHNTSFEVTCNSSLNKPFLRQFNLELLDVDLVFLQVTLKIDIASNSKCPGNEGASAVWTSTSFTGSPFRYSSGDNRFTVVGCDNALLTYEREIMAGCTSSCINITSSNITSCYGLGCCKTTIPTDLDIYTIDIISSETGNCTKAFLAKYDWSLLNKTVYEIDDHVPVVMVWTPPHYSRSRSIWKTPSYDCFSQKKSQAFSCDCGEFYEGSPFIPNGCKVVEACADCKKDCTESPWDNQRQISTFYCNRSNKTEIILASSLGGGLLLLLLCGFCLLLHKYIKRRRIRKLKKKFFEKNGGLLLQQKISSDEDIVEQTIVFTSQELEKATDNFNENRILGRGGQGTVYKGMLMDGKIIAIKKSMVVDESQLEQFINEVVILSQINHRNIVKLLGCCLETEVPLLVYEFISNGNLFQLIHDQSEEFPLSWKMRLQIATEIAGALAYLHSASSLPIYHRDIKSTNILLDEKFRAKVADFGTSRSIAIEQTHLTTVVHGTFGYLDPEYFQSSQFTEKSDVYSYGVVLVELLTGQKAISSTISEEERSLATRFLVFLKEMRLFDLLDSSVREEARQEDITAVANIAKRCLSLSGKKRPTMKEVMMELEGIRMSLMPLTTPNQFHQDEFIMEMKGPLYDASTSTHCSQNYSRVFSDVDPLLLKTV